MLSSEAFLPALVCWDFASAFPSLSHERLYLVLQKKALPLGFANFVSGIYAGSAAATSVLGIAQILFLILRGVLQGCPLSGILCSWALDPLLSAMEQLLDVAAGRSREPVPTTSALRC